MRLSSPRCRALAAGTVVVLLGGAVATGEKSVVVLERPLALDAKDQPPIQYWKEGRAQPRPLQMHHLKIDLKCPRYEPAAVVADDPDGNGPAEAKLEPPVPLASRHKVVAAVNANAFALLPGESEHGMVADAPVNIVSWAVTGARQVSPPQPRYVSFWLDPKGGAHIADPSASLRAGLAAPKEAREAVAGFGSLLVDGQLSPKSGGPLHPRTAAGLDRDGRWLWLVVVDGRQPGYSEGMTLHELATLMKELGCWNALNLDGGGSTVMLVATDGGDLQIVNRPSDRDLQGRPKPRPVPVLLGIRARSGGASP
jgi:hypothetical protein